MAPGDVAPKQITHVFDYLGRDVALGAQEAITWKGADGVTIEGLVTYPVDYQAGRKYPLAVHDARRPTGGRQVRRRIDGSTRSRCSPAKAM